MIKRIQQAFQKGPVKAAYVMAGDGGFETTVNMALALIAGGANLLEIGIPFSDPIADGPVIQAAAVRALQANTTLNDVFRMVQYIRDKTTVPIVLMSYFNPIYQYSLKKFLVDAKNAGVDGLITVDLPFEELFNFQSLFVDNNIDPILLLTPNTPDIRIKKITQHASGFLYYACRRGTTGTRDVLPNDLAQKIAEIKSYTDLPILVGFGISNRHMVEEVLQHAEGLVIASYFVEAIAKGASFEEIKNCTQKLYS